MLTDDFNSLENWASWKAAYLEQSNPSNPEVYIYKYLEHYFKDSPTWAKVVWNYILEEEALAAGQEQESDFL